MWTRTRATFARQAENYFKIYLRNRPSAVFPIQCQFISGKNAAIKPRLSQNFPNFTKPTFRILSFELLHFGINSKTTVRYILLVSVGLKERHFVGAVISCIYLRREQLPRRLKRKHFIPKRSLLLPNVNKITSFRLANILILDRKNHVVAPLL